MQPSEILLGFTNFYIATKYTTRMIMINIGITESVKMSNRRTEISCLCNQVLKTYGMLFNDTLNDTNLNDTQKT